MKNQRVWILSQVYFWCTFVQPPVQPFSRGITRQVLSALVAPSQAA